MTTPPSDAPTTWLGLLERARHRGRQDPTSRYLQLATVGPDGAPHCRTIVVREVDESRLRFVTDARSAKIDQLLAESRVEACWYFSESREQFRLSGRAHRLGPGDPVLLRLWRGLSPTARASFAWPLPGTVRHEDDCFASSLAEPDPRPDFVVVEVAIAAVDWLSLLSSPHERRRFTLAGDGWHSERLRP